MKSDRKPSKVDGLLNVLLADDDWQALNVSLKQDALAAMASARRQRRMGRWLRQAACVAVLLVGTVWWLGPSPRPKVAVVATSAQGNPSGLDDRFISEEEMLAAFPAGSCVVAEIDGQKTLVFFDAKKAEEGFSIGWAH